MSEQEALPWKLYNGMTGRPAIMILSVRTDPQTHQHMVRTEVVEGVTEEKVMTACKLRVDDLEKDPTCVRIVVSVVTSERRREATEVFGRQVVLPFNRVNGKH